MSNIERDFRTKAAASTGIYHPDGSRFGRWGMESRASINTPPPGPNSGPQMPAPPNSGPQRPGTMSRLATGAIRAIHGGETVVEAARHYGSAAMKAGKSLSSSLPGRAATALGKGAIRAAPWLAGAADAAGVVDVATDPNKTKLDVGAEVAGDVGRWTSAGLGAKVGVAAGTATGPLAPVAVPVLGLAGGVAGYFGADKLIKGLGGERPSDTSNGVVSQAVAGTPLDFRGSTSTGVDAVTQAAPVVKPTASAQPKPLSPELQRVKDSTFDADSDPFTRRADPEVELARQAGNFNQFEAPINAALADRVKASGGVSSFRDAAAQALFNAKQGLNGSGISVSDVNGTPTFTGDNRAGGGQLYRAADGSVTNDWSKTQQYADAIQRNAKDQDRLAELTRGAALSGDKEAVARLTHGDQRLAGIAAEAATEKSLRDAVKGGSRNAAMVLADMEKSKATQGMVQAELGLKRAVLVGAQEDRDLNRQLRQDSLNAKIAENKRSAEKDARDNAQALEEREYRRLKDISTVDGKTNPALLSANQGVASQYGNTGDPALDLRDKLVQARLQSNLAGGQAFYDRMFSSPVGTEVQPWHANEGFGRGGFKTEDGKHMSEGQIRSLPIDEQQAFFGTIGPDGKPLMNGRLKTGKVPQWYLDRMKGGK